MVPWIPFTVLGLCITCGSPSADSWLNQDRICRSFWTFALLDCWNPWCWLDLGLGSSRLVLYKILASSFFFFTPEITVCPSLVHPQNNNVRKRVRLSELIIDVLIEFSFLITFRGDDSQVQLLLFREGLCTSYKSSKSLKKYRAL